MFSTFDIVITNFFDYVQIYDAMIMLLVELSNIFPFQIFY